VDTPQSYYQISQLENSEPILVMLAFSGDPLTKEELDRISITCDVEGTTVIAEPDYENSAYKLRFDPNDPPSSGKQRIKITATGTNEIGEQESLDRKTGVEFGTLPTWLRMLIPILGILVLLAIILLILNQKVLPKKIQVREMEFNVGGEDISVQRSPVFDGAGKNKGSIKIYSPKAGNDPFAEQAMFLTVSAISPRRTPSKQRKARVTNVQLRGPQNIIYWRLKTQTFEPDPEKPGGFINTVTGKSEFKSVDIGPTTDVEIQAETEDSSVIFRCKFNFR